MTIRKIIGALALMGLMASANAASISLVPTSSVDGVAPGDIVSFDVIMDFTDQSTIGGGFDIVFDETALMFVGLNNAQLGDPSFGRDPDVLPGLLESWAFANFNPLTGPDLVGSVQFQVLSGFVGVTTVATQATSGIGGPFVDGTDFVSLIDVQYNSVDVSAVPVPAAVWFMLSGLGALIGFGRKAA